MVCHKIVKGFIMIGNRVGVLHIGFNNKIEL